MSHQSIFIDIWIDVGCPFCYIQLPIFDALREAYGEAVTFRRHAFEIVPAPAPLFDPKGTRFLKVSEDVIVPSVLPSGSHGCRSLSFQMVH